MKTICISAGHYTFDPGAVYGNLQERDLTIEITNAVAEMLRLHGIGVLDVPDDIDLVGTIAWINARASQIDCAVEIHINAGWGTGMETWYYHADVTSKKLAQFINDACIAETGLKDRGVKDEFTAPPGRLGFVHDTQPLAVLTECGFIDGDNNFLSNKENRYALAKGVARGILSYFGITWSPSLLTPVTPQVPTPTPPPVESPSDKAIKEIKAVLKKYNL